MRFSQRIGKTPVRDQLQIEGMDKDLRNGLWDIVRIVYLTALVKRGTYIPEADQSDWCMELSDLLWHYFFKEPLDTIPEYPNRIVAYVRKWFFDAESHQVYDLLEFLIQNYEDKAPEATELFNRILERELSGFRIINGEITPITAKEEIAEIESALENTSPLKNVNEHLSRAIALLSDRKKPDFPNSINESISAVEAICGLICEDKNPTLSKCLKKLKDKIDIHPALEGAFDKLYAWTSSDAGIRHAKMNEDDLAAADARFMLISCSAFINYLIDKCAQAGIELTGGS